MFLALPALAAVVLALPCFSFTYLWDDYDFLARAHPFRLESLLPDPGTVFYRPISRELPFSVLGLSGMSGIAVGHVVNAVLLATAVMLTGWLGARLAGRKEGILAGCVLASLGAVPILVGWCSGIQDLLAAVLGLTAIHLRLGNRAGLAVAALAAAILSKETALAFAPIVAALPWIVGRASPRAFWGAAAVAVLLVAWAFVHPGVRILLEGKKPSAESEYVAVAPPNRPQFAFQSALALLNVPATGVKTRWPEGRTGVALVAGALVAAALLGSRRIPPSDEPRAARRTLALAILLLVGPLLVTIALVIRWSPYYAFLPGLGLSLAAGIGLARVRTGAAALALLGFLAAGVWYRGLEGDPTVTTERSLENTSSALRQVQSGFERVLPELPEAAQLLVSVPGTGSLSVPIHLLRFAAPKVWYGRPDLIVRSPQDRIPWHGTDVLVRVTHALDVVRIDPFTLDVRHTGPSPDASDVTRPIRTYARALGATGEPDHAVEVLRGLAAIDPPPERGYDFRLMAMILHQAGRREEAAVVLAGAPPLNREVATMAVAKLMLERAGDPATIDSSAAFSMGLQADDAELYRYLMHRADQAKDRDLALLAAHRLLGILGTDAEASAFLRRYETAETETRITPPAMR